MIASLKGKLQYKGLDKVVVDVGGVGYLVHVSMQTLAALPEQGAPVQLLCHTHVREDALQIFGFLEEQEQRVFGLLIGVSGVGPKLALVTLAGMPVGELVQAIAGGDHKRLQSIPGVGKKTAERMVVDLKERCVKLGKELALPQAQAGAATEEVVEALVNLGYKRTAAEKAVAKVEKANPHQAGSPERVLRDALVAIREL